MEPSETTYQAFTPVPNGVKPPTKRIRKALPSLPSTASATNMTDVDYHCKVDGSPISWDSLPLYGVFSLSPDGSYPHVKVSCSKACDLRTGKSIPVGSGRCYRVVL